MPEEILNNADLIQEFLTESRDNMDQMERDLMAWEKQPASRDTLDRIFRAIHTLKGTCGFLGFTKLEGLAHQTEGLLGHLREGQIKASPAIVTVLLHVLDSVRRHTGHIERTGKEESESFGSVLAALQALQEPALTETPMPDEIPDTEAPAGFGTSAENSIRVKVGLLDRLMNLAGELVLVRNQISQLSQNEGPQMLAGPAQKLNRITSELQASIMKTRLQPIGNIWSKFPRLVRDAAMAGDKKIRLEMSGQQTELDKSIIEAVKDPLTHLIRNCIDHGIETPERRIAAGKPEEGAICLRACHEAGLVLIEISDDGGGIRPEIIREAALRRGLLAPSQADTMTNYDLIQLIFLPGFSTSREVTRLSGRGIGMDVVKTNLDRIGGAIEVASAPGQGTTFKIKLPLTLAIIPALLVGSGDERFAIPQASVRELVRLDGADAARKIEWIEDSPVYRLRGQLLPLIDLGRELGFSAQGHEMGQDINIVVLDAHGGSFGLIVDHVQDTEEIVVKPLGRLLKSLHVFAGATIMGDGHVILILNVLGLAQRVKNNEANEKRPVPVPTAMKEEARAPGEELLVFQLGDDGRWAIALSEVTRLEEFDAAKIEREGAVPAVQYQGKIMPLLPLSHLLLAENERLAFPASSGKFQVIVHARDGLCYGLLVDHIVDIAREPLVLQRKGLRPGILGSAIIQNRITKIVDIDGLVNLDAGRANGQFLGEMMESLN
ncbi:MAG TPA: chemotaxis protein CheA [Candidatus Methylacidiphilales bacterium]|nr:chemotaxis protein CheA [Candidatus Methylacidiphilales bacterium]